MSQAAEHARQRESLCKGPEATYPKISTMCRSGKTRNQTVRSSAAAGDTGEGGRNRWSVGGV